MLSDQLYGALDKTPVEYLREACFSGKNKKPKYFQENR